jgi:hypothetical protein
MSDSTKDNAKPKKKRTGRQSEFNQRTADRICAQLAEGKSLRRICARKDMPQKRTVLRWLEEKPDFAAQYARARDEQADGYFDELMDLQQRANADNAHAIRVRADIIKWACSKLKPKKYGDRLGVDMQADITMREKHPWDGKQRSEWSPMDEAEFERHHAFCAYLMLKAVEEKLGIAKAHELLVGLAKAIEPRLYATQEPRPIALPAPPDAPSTRAGAREDDGDVIDGDAVVI